MLKIISWSASLLTVGFLFLGFWSLCYIEVDFSWNGLMISLLIAFVFWLLAAISCMICKWAAWKDQENERQRRAVRRYKERKGGK